MKALFDLIPTNLWWLLGGMIAGFLLPGRREYFRRRLHAVWDHCKHLVFRRKPVVLVWTDDKQKKARELCGMLEDSLRDVDIRFKWLTSACDVLDYSWAPKYTRAIILIDTDVTQFHHLERMQNTVQDHIIRYVERGGVCIAVHDVLYRRTRNDALSDAYGYHISEFKRCPGDDACIRYRKTGECPEEWKGPEVLDLEDAEYLWDPDQDVLSLIHDKGVDVIYELAPQQVDRTKIPDGYRIPLVISRVRGRDVDEQEVQLDGVRRSRPGVFIWVNGPCHFAQKAARALSGPQREFVELLACCLKYSAARVRRES